MNLYLSVALAFILCSTLTFGQATPTGVCTGYPKMYNGLPCASTTRYWDGQMGACGCGTGNEAPFSWQWTLGTAAGSAPIYGSGTWCGSGCGKCYQLTPTAVGASPDGRGAPNLTPLVIKVTNLCPYTGNEQWCAYDINTYGYDAHFDLMDHNMAGLISVTMGWDNPEVTYQEVDCAAHGYTDWSCECANNGLNSTSSNEPTSAPATSAPTTPSQAATNAPTSAPTSKTPTSAPTTKKPTKAPTHAPTQKPTKAPKTKAPTNAPTHAATASPATTEAAPVTVGATSAPVATAAPTGITIQINGGSSAWWLGFSIISSSSTKVAKVEIQDGGQAVPTWTTMSYQGNSNWNLYSVNPLLAMSAPLSLRFTSTDGTVVTANNIITTFSAATINTGVAL